MTRPLATYRLQFHGGFGFDDAATLADYLAALGISHLYASPILQAAAGSAHGYDVVDTGRVDETRGGREGYARLCRALGASGLGQALDIVPNHMAITGSENRWWWDVLENGPSSPYAFYFDVDWDLQGATASNRILLPILRDHCGREIEAGHITLQRNGGRFFIRYFDAEFPAAPRSLSDLLAEAGTVSGSDELLFLADALMLLPLPTATDRESTRTRYRNKEVIRDLLERLLSENPDAAASVDVMIERVNGDPDAMDALLEQQNYRLALWRMAREDLGYRRFFDINTMAALRTEDLAVFLDSHHLILRWIAEGVLDGLRIDHIDGLRDPEGYLRRLRESAPRAWIVVEKILDPSEPLRETWPVQGTTGYDFLNAAGGLFVDPSGEKPLTDFYREFTGEPAGYADVLREKKRLVTTGLLGSELNRLTEILMQICERHRRYRDFTRRELSEALAAVVVCFPVYRTYVHPARAEQVAPEDQRYVTEAVAAAKTLESETDPVLIDFIADLLLLEVHGDRESEFVLRFQQLTGPAMAKGAEDTAFYCYNRFVALNEVGGDPSSFGVSPEAFHRRMVETREGHPETMLATSTHDTKRSEDVRARLVLLSEIPARWTAAVRRWSARNERYREEGAPDRNAEYLLYQTLVGAWPIGADRLGAFMEKAAREAKQHTSWNHPDAVYEERLQRFVNRLFDDKEFIVDLTRFVEPLIDAGRRVSLAQTLLKLTAPGVPDLYQGSELWDLSLVDPDNRRPVDFALRRRLLAELAEATPEEVMGRMEEGLPKLWVIWKALTFRRRRPEILGPAAPYLPLEAAGSRASHVVAFLRGEGAVTVVPRLILSLGGRWENTAITLPAGTWHNPLTGEELKGGIQAVEDVLHRFPVALLTRTGL